VSSTVTISTTSNSQMLKAMVGIGVLCGLLIVLTYEGTLPRVERLRAEALQRAVFTVIPGAEDSKAFSWDGNGFGEVNESSTEILYAGYDSSGGLKGIAIEASGQGYADVIRILYGYNPIDQTVIGFYVLESKETPGLGDKIEKDATFLANFKALDVQINNDQQGLANAVIPVKSGAKVNAWEVDAITGATISSRAIADMINVSMQKWASRIQMNKQLFELNE